MEKKLEHRKISDTELQQILEDHRNWLKYRTKEGKRADLSGSKLWGEILSGANLKRSNLSCADLSHSDLNNANLSGADLCGADLCDADLIGSNLSGADLKNSNLRRTNLSGADLSHSDLKNAYLSGTNLSGADLSDVYLGYTVFVNVDLSMVKGLDKAKHLYPSSIGIDTIYKSKGKIPEVFYRGAGLEENFINHIPSFVNQPIQFYSCFISYANKDYDFAERLYADLQNKGVRCWFAPEKMKIGEEIRNMIDSVIRQHDKLLVILSENSIESEWVKDEVETAYERERNSKKTFLFPIRIDSEIKNTKEAWASKLRRQRHIGDFSNWKEDHNAYKKAFESLLSDLRFENTNAE